MLITSDIVREKVFTELNTSAFWDVFSVQPPNNVLRYIMLESINESEQNDKLSKHTSGTMTINIVERFNGNSGTLANVDAQARAVSEHLMPTTKSVLGNFKGIAIFSTNIATSTGQLFEVGSGRIAIRTLILNYRTQKL